MLQTVWGKTGSSSWRPTCTGAHPQIAPGAGTDPRTARSGDVRAHHRPLRLPRPPTISKGRLFNRTLGGGGILDVGGYCTSMVRLIAGATQGKSDSNRTRVFATGQIGVESGVDEYASALLHFPGDIVAMLSCGPAVPAGQQGADRGHRRIDHPSESLDGQHRRGAKRRSSC